MKNIFWTFLKIMFLVIIFTCGYLVHYSGVTIPPIEQGMAKVSTLCGVGDKSGVEKK